MKKILASLTAILMMASFASLPALAEAPSAETEQYTITQAYEYPVLPGTPEWIALDDRKEACQIPEEILTEMTTEALIETCLNYPFAADIYAFNSVSQGITVVSSYFNGLQELQSRPDGAEKLLAAYGEMPVVNEQSRAPSEEKFEESTKLTFLEGILSDEHFFGQLSEEEAVQFEGEVAEKYEERQENASLYLNPSPYYEKAAVDQGIVPLDTAVTIKTPKGSSVTVYIRSEMAPGAIKDLNDYYDARYPTASRQVTASNKYNCHNFAWNNQSKSYWMDNPFPYINDKSYRIGGKLSEDGNIIYWVHNGNADTATKIGTTHSGITQNGKMLSKWGPAGLYLSEVVGNDGSPYNFYKVQGYYYK